MNNTSYAASDLVQQLGIGGWLTGTVMREVAFMAEYNAGLPLLSVDNSTLCPPVTFV
jgi:hypothetical protein